MKHLICTTLLTVCISISAFAGIDMQAHVASDEGMNAYTDYVSRQASYYADSYTYSNLAAQQGDYLFGSLNSLMGQTSKIGSSSYSYNSLRSAYAGVDRDLNRAGYIIGYYDGYSFEGDWDSGNTWNREHTWPQSKGANKSIPMGHDMQSVRPTRTAVNSNRGNTPYGEGKSYYDPDEVKINNKEYKTINRGSYRGDCARVILYDYIVYGKQGAYSNNLYNNQAQLLNKLGSSGVFESVEMLLKWHMQDPPSLTEMVRNDGAEDYQGNRNPFIDFPEFAIQILKDEVTTYTVTCNQPLNPNYTLSTKYGFVAYLTDKDGHHPSKVQVSGATGEYEASLGRLTVTHVTGNVRIQTDGTNTGIDATEKGTFPYYTCDGVLYITHPEGQDITIYNLLGYRLVSKKGQAENCALELPRGTYLLQIGKQRYKVLL